MGFTRWAFFLMGFFFQGFVQESSSTCVIRTLVEGLPMTCAYGPLSGKKRMHYEEFFQMVLDTKNWTVLLIQKMFTLTSVHQAIHNILGSFVGIKGCFYHLTRGTWQKIQELGLLSL